MNAIYSDSLPANIEINTSIMGYIAAYVITYDEVLNLCRDAPGEVARFQQMKRDGYPVDKQIIAVTESFWKNCELLAYMKTNKLDVILVKHD